MKKIVNSDQALAFYQQMFQCLPGFIFVKDEQCRIIFTNDFSAKIYGFDDAESMLGVDPHDYRCPVVEAADEFIKQDKQVLHSQSLLTILNIQVYADNRQRILLTQKVPFCVEPLGFVGSMSHCTELQSDTMQKIAGLLAQSDQHYYDQQTEVNRSYNVVDDIEVCELSPRQLECLFYLIRGNTAKETGRHLGITSRTVEAHLNRIKQKWQVSRKSDVIDCAINKGLLSYVPKAIIFSQISKVMHEDNDLRLLLGEV